MPSSYREFSKRPSASSVGGRYNSTMDSLQFLAKSGEKLGPLCVVYGDEAFLKRRALAAIRQRALGTEGNGQSGSTYPGDKAQYAEVFDELNTLPFFQP